MSMDSGKLRETADAAVSSLTSAVSAYQRVNELWYEYTGAAFPASNVELSVALFAGQQKLTELDAHCNVTEAMLYTAEASATLVLNNQKSNLNAVGLMHGIQAGKSGITQNRQAIAEIQQQPTQFESLSDALNHMSTLAIQKTVDNDAIIAQMRLGIDHGQKYKPII